MPESHIETIRNRHASIKIQVQNHIDWNDYRYGEFQELAGLEFLKLTYGDSALSDAMKSMREFWAWWRMAWIEVDKEFLDLSSMLFRAELETYYKELHAAHKVTLRPHRVIINKCFNLSI